MDIISNNNYLDPCPAPIKIYYGTELPKIKEKELNDALSRMNFNTVVSYATRPIRDGETNGVEHYFITDKEADEMLLDQRNIAAFTTIGNYRYFTTWEEIRNKNMYVIDPRGIEDFICRGLMSRNLPSKVIIVYIETGSMVRYLRARKRPGFNKNIYKERVDSENVQFLEFESRLDETYQSEFSRHVNGSLYVINNNRGLHNTMLQINKMLLQTYNDNINMVYLFVGRSCSGKDTICKEILAEVNRRKS